MIRCFATSDDQNGHHDDISEKFLTSRFFCFLNRSRDGSGNLQQKKNLYDFFFSENFFRPSLLYHCLKITPKQKVLYRTIKGSLAWFINGTLLGCYIEPYLGFFAKNPFGNLKEFVGGCYIEPFSCPRRVHCKVLY